MLALVNPFRCGCWPFDALESWHVPNVCVMQSWVKNSLLQDNSENDVRLFGIALQSTEVKEPGSLNPPSTSGCHQDSLPTSDAVTIASADWRRTASEQARAAQQFFEQGLVLPASAARAEPVPAQNRAQTSQELGIHADDAAGADRAAGEKKTQDLPEVSRSEAGTVRETQTEHVTSVSVASGRSGIRVLDATPARSAATGSFPKRADAHNYGQLSEVYTIADTQAGNSHVNDIIGGASKGDCTEDSEEEAEVHGMLATQLQEPCDFSTFPETQLEPVLPSWHTCATTQITGQDGDARQDGLTPVHSTDTQPADAPLSPTANMMSTDTAAEGGQAQSGLTVHECAASVDPLADGLVRPGSDDAQQMGTALGGKGGRQLPVQAGASPQLPFDESGNITYLCARPDAHEHPSTPPPPDVCRGARAAQETVVEAIKDVREPDTVPAPDEAANRVGNTVPDQLQEPVASELPGNRNGGSAAVDPMSPPAGEDGQEHPAVATRQTQATVCDSSDGKPEAPPAADGPRHKYAVKAVDTHHGCESTSRGTVPETHTGDGHAEVLPSQQV